MAREGSGRVGRALCVGSGDVESGGLLADGGEGSRQRVWLSLPLAAHRRRPANLSPSHTHASPPPRVPNREDWLAPHT